MNICSTRRPRDSYEYRKKKIIKNQTLIILVISGDKEIGVPPWDTLYTKLTLNLDGGASVFKPSSFVYKN